ncbi:MAG: quinolinate synthase [Candidatus Omnitrophica bacterium 4484_171]|nr:MAG: quinolinate synthase [Candidatus Omnitrophica bacterium 4484_171]
MDTASLEGKTALKEKILALKNRLKAVILTHNYQIPEIQELADFCGDSLELAKISKGLKEKVIVFCGVKFMAETAKILSPRKRVFLPVLGAGCPLADTITPLELIELKNKYPDAWVVSYVNTSAEIKSLSDVCCTSSNAVSVVKNVPADRIIFIPDKNLGAWVKKNVPEKEITTHSGFCYVHEQFSLNDLKRARELYPPAKIMVHPECRSELQDAADFVVSTSGMLKAAKKSSADIFIIGTEKDMIYRLEKENPEKKFYSLGNTRACIDMKKTTLDELYKALLKERYEITIDKSIIDKADRALKEMIKYV